MLKWSGFALEYQWKYDRYSCCQTVSLRIIWDLTSGSCDLIEGFDWDASPPNWQNKWNKLTALKFICVRLSSKNGWEERGFQRHGLVLLWGEG